MNNQPLPLESEFEVKRLELYLDQNPEKAQELAIIYFEDYLELVQEYKKLEQQKKSPSLPPIPPPSLSRLQAEYDDLREEYAKVLKVNDSLRREVKELTELSCALSDEDYPLPSFLKEAFDE